MRNYGKQQNPWKIVLLDDILSKCKRCWNIAPNYMKVYNGNTLIPSFISIKLHDLHCQCLDVSQNIKKRSYMFTFNRLIGVCSVFPVVNLIDATNLVTIISTSSLNCY